MLTKKERDQMLLEIIPDLKIKPDKDIDNIDQEFQKYFMADLQEPSYLSSMYSYFFKSSNHYTDALFKRIDILSQRIELDLKKKADSKEQKNSEVKTTPSL